MNLEHIDELLDAYVLDELTPDQAAQLHESLQSDPAARARFAQSMMLEAGLHQVARDESVRNEPRPKVSNNSWRRRFAIAASVVVAVGIVAAYYFGRPDSSTLARVTSGDVQVNGQPLENIPEGAEMHVMSLSPAVIRLSDGSVATLDPDTHLTVANRTEGVRQVLRLSTGGGRFYVMHGGGQFRIETPAGNVTVLGTEFTAVLRSPQSLFISVTTGSVRVDSNHLSSTISAGESVTFGPQTKVVPPSPSVVDSVPPKAAPNDGMDGVMDGLIHAVDLKAGAFVLGGKNETETTFRFGVSVGDKRADCLLLLNGKMANPETAMKPGRKARVTYVKVGEDFGASKVEVTTGAK